VVQSIFKLLLLRVAVLVTVAEEHEWGKAKGQLNLRLDIRRIHCFWQWESVRVTSIQGGQDPWDALCLQVSSRKQALYFMGDLLDETCKIRHPMGCRHPVACFAEARHLCIESITEWNIIGFWHSKEAKTHRMLYVCGSVSAYELSLGG